MLWIDFLKKISLKFLVLLLVSGCLTPIDFPVEIKGGTLVVTGQISTISDQNIIQLGRTANIAQLPFPLSGATIQLFDDIGDSFRHLARWRFRFNKLLDHGNHPLIITVVPI